MRYIALVAVVALRTLLASEPVDTKSETTAAWRIIDESIRDGSSEEHREQALAALSTFGDSNSEAVQRAVRALHDKDAVIRRSAAIALGELKAHSALADLKQALNDTPEVSFAAAKALTRLGDTSGRDVMIAVLAGERKDAPGMFTNAMRDAKDRLHHPEGLFLMGTEDAAGSMFGPASMVIPAVKDTTDLRAKGAPGKAAAVAYLAKYPDPYAVQLLEWALDDGNQFVRLEAAKALGDRGNAESIQKLDKLLDDQHNIVRDMAAVSILRILDRDGEEGAIAPGPVQQPKTDKKSP
jgi:HEAT repeat protein